MIGLQTTRLSVCAPHEGMLEQADTVIFVAGDDNDILAAFGRPYVPFTPCWD